MELLQERIRREGRVLPGNIVKVDGFLNHRVDTRLLEDIADEFAKYFDTSKITVVLTAEASGIALATICAQKYGVPMLFAKKAKSDNIESGLYQSEVFSYTYKKRVTLLVSQEWLNADDHVLIIDDFMANGEAVRGLCDLVFGAIGFQPLELPFGQRNGERVIVAFEIRTVHKLTSLHVGTTSIRNMLWLVNYANA